MTGGTNGKPRPGPILVPDEDGEFIGMRWDEETHAPVPITRPEPVDLRDGDGLEPEEEPLRLMLRRVGAAALRRIARKLDP